MEWVRWEIHSILALVAADLHPMHLQAMVKPLCNLNLCLHLFMLSLSLSLSLSLPVSFSLVYLKEIWPPQLYSIISLILKKCVYISFPFSVQQTRLASLVATLQRPALVLRRSSAASAHRLQWATTSYFTTVATVKSPFHCGTAAMAH